MATTDFRQRTAMLFIAVTLGHIILISAQVNSRAGVPLLEVVTFGAFAEVQRGVASLTGGIRNAWTNYVDLRDLRGENAALKREMADLQLKLQRERASAARTQQLERLLGFQQELQVQTVAAGVIGTVANIEYRGVTIDKGSLAGVASNMAVVAPTGVVGRVVTSTRHASKVQLLIDRNAAAGALVERSRAQGVVVGAGEELVRMDFVAATADVKIGDVIVTSGIDGIYPKGFVIGKVVQVNNGNGIYKAIRLRPTVDYNSLEEVLIVKTPPPQSVTEERS